MIRFAALIIGLLMLAPAAFADPAADLDRLIAEVEAFDLAEDPVEAGRLGDRAALARLPVATAEADARRLDANRGFLERARAIPTDDLTPTQTLNRDLLAFVLGERVRLGAYDDARFPFNSIHGFHQLPLNLTYQTAIRTPDDARAMIARFADTPRYFAEHQANLARAVETGWTQPEGIVRIVIKQLDDLTAAEPGKSPFMASFDALAEDFPERAALLDEAEATIREHVYPAYKALAAFMRQTYLPAARPDLGVRSVPGGAAYYRDLVRHYTTLDLHPDDIHETGKQEVRRIRAAMDAIIEEVGFDGDFAAFQAFLRTDPQFYTDDAEQLMKENAYLAKLADRQMPRFFRTLPRLPYGVRPMPEAVAVGGTTAYYQPGDVVNGIAGDYAVNTTALDQRPLFEVPALTMHEAVPGHHHQIALAMEIEDAPEFRKRLYVTAFGEGWGLYAETLCGEMGLCRTPYDHFGQLSYQMWRACRLVADTGLHWKGWNRDQAEACFLENSALSEQNIRAEVNRYISYPGQALAYKTGQMKIRELRTRAEDALGAAFDIRDFHDAVLLQGTMPLSMLEARIDAWIAAQAGE